MTETMIGTMTTKNGGHRARVRRRNESGAAGAGKTSEGAGDLLPLAILGAGSMAQALIRGLLAAGMAAPGDIRVTNRSDRARLAAVAETYGVRACLTKREALDGARTVVVATKPADVAGCLEECRPWLAGADGLAPDAGRPGASPLPLVVSVAAGVSTQTIERLLPARTPVVRAMPNTSCGVRESATAIAPGRWATPTHLAAARLLFEVVGLVVELDESKMDAITGLSGSGPAYVYLMLEAMTEAGAGLGLDPDLAYKLALQTLRGAAATAQLTGEDPAELRRKVTSPGGTTMAGLAALERAGFKQGLIEAVRRAAERAAELAPGAPAARGRSTTET